MYGLGISTDGLNVYVTDDCLYVVFNYKRNPDTGSLTFEDEINGNSFNGDGLGCIKSLSFSSNGVSIGPVLRGVIYIFICVFFQTRNKTLNTYLNAAE